MVQIIVTLSCTKFRTERFILADAIIVDGVSKDRLWLEEAPDAVARSWLVKFRDDFLEKITI